MKQFADTYSDDRDDAPAPRAGDDAAPSAPSRPGRVPLLTGVLAALADPMNLRVLRLLEREELTVGELAKVLQLPQSTVSRRLKTLADAAWLVRRAEGPATFHRLILDDLPAEARALWVTVRDPLEQIARTGAAPAGEGLSSAQLKADVQRLDAVVAERATDSTAFFGRFAGEWDAIRSELFGAGFTARGLLALLPAEWTVADLGCGTGNAAEHLAPFVEKVVAVDQSAPMLRAAKKRLAAFENVEFVRAELHALPLESASVDAAVFALVLHHIEDPAAALREAARVLRPGGLALVIDMQEHDRTTYRTSMGHKHLGFSGAAVDAMFHAAGLERPRAVPLSSDPEGKGPTLFAAAGRRPMKN